MSAEDFSRKKKTIKNGTWGLIYKTSSVLIGLIVRYFFIRVLDPGYLGLEGLFINVIGLFALVDMGFSTAISFNLYQPIRDNNKSLISAIVRLYRKIYLIFGLVIALLSLIATPIVPSLIRDCTVDPSRVRIAFLIYAACVAVSYLFSYKRNILFAYQRNYICLKVDTAIRLLAAVLELVSLLLFHDYIVYIVILSGSLLLQNIIISIRADRLDLYDLKDSTALPSEYTSKIKNYVKNLAVMDTAWKGIHSTDNIIISYFIGNYDLSRNANYTSIGTAVRDTVISFLGGSGAPIGDLLAEGDSRKIRKYFDRNHFIYEFAGVFCMLEFFFCINPFISFWVGDSFRFDTLTVFFIALDMFLYLSFIGISDYLNLSGCVLRYTPYSIVALIINIGVSIVFGITIGTAGVFIGTSVTYIFMLSVISILICRNVTHTSVWQYWKVFLKNVVLLSLTLVLSESMLLIIPELSNLLLTILANFVVCLMVFIMVTLLIYNKDSNYVFFKDLAKNLIRKWIVSKKAGNDIGGDGV